MMMPDFPILLCKKNINFFTALIDGLTVRYGFDGEPYIEVCEGEERYLFYAYNTSLAVMRGQGICLITNNRQYEKRFFVKRKSLSKLSRGK